ncbi:MAG: AraC family transcriptional regulator [Burkholderiales bacterium]|nr:AraC family transcriptional regulator [Burkholderiales bacterium]
MTQPDPTREYAQYHRPARFEGLELLTAHFYAHEFTPHVHDGYAIALVEQGAERFRYRGTEHVATPGTVAIINPGEVHTGSRAAEEGWSYRVFYPTPELMRTLAESMDGWTGGTPYFTEAVTHDPALVASMRALHAAMTGTASVLERESRWFGAMGSLFTRHARGVRVQAGTLQVGTALERAREILLDRMTEQVGLTALATEVGLSAWHLNRAFRERFGLPPHAYLQQLRVARARVLLRSPCSIADIAGKLGFADQAHLTRLFKRTFGVTPGAYRRAA